MMLLHRRQMRLGQLDILGSLAFCADSLPEAIAFMIIELDHTPSISG